jgi:hypothetical protein
LTSSRTPIDRRRRQLAETRPGGVGYVRDRIAGADGSSNEPAWDETDATGFNQKAFLSGVLNRRRSDIRLFEVYWIRVPPGWEGKLPPIVVQTPTLKSSLHNRLMYLAMCTELAAVAVRREIDLAKEAARDRCLSAIDRALALTRLDVLLRLVTALAVEVLNLIRPELPPRILSAGGQTSAFTPLT